MISKAYAMAGQAAAGQQGSPYEGIIMLVLMFAIFYFLLIRPQQKRAKQHKELVSSLKAGDQIISAGGIHGKIVSVDENVVTVEVSTGVKIKMNRSAITDLKTQS